jgi:hypothetical protein
MPVPHPAVPSRFRRPALTVSTCSASVRVLARPMATRTPSRVVVHRNTRPATPLPPRRRAGDADQSGPGYLDSPRHAAARQRWRECAAQRCGIIVNVTFMILMHNLRPARLYKPSALHLRRLHPPSHRRRIPRRLERRPITAARPDLRALTRQAGLGQPPRTGRPRRRPRRRPPLPDRSPGRPP